MPKLDIVAIPKILGAGYPPPFDQPCVGRVRQRLGKAGDCAAFPKGSGNGHHLINRSDVEAIYLEIGSRAAADLTVCSDIDMMSANSDGRFVHKDGTAYTGN